MDIITRNFFHILQQGAFHEKNQTEPMSPFKWKRLIQMAQDQGVTAYFTHVTGNNHQQSDDDEATDEQLTDVTNLNNRYLNHQLIKILETEKNDEDAQPETQQLLAIIIYNVKKMLNSKLSLKGIIELGKFLRTKGHKVDFVKIEKWLNKLHLKRIAQLQGSILITDFNFQEEEIPFVEKIEKDAHKLLLKTIAHTQNDAAEEWHFRQRENGFVRNNSRLMRRNIRRNARYLKYAAIESTSTFVANFLKSLSEIEE